MSAGGWFRSLTSLATGQGGADTMVPPRLGHPALQPSRGPHSTSAGKRNMTREKRVMVDSAKKPWQQSPKPPRRTAPVVVPRYRPLDARLPGESLQAYRAFLAYLAHGSIRRAADALGRPGSRSTFERWSIRWRWPLRKADILRRHAGAWADLAGFEERHELEASGDLNELVDRQLRARIEIGEPRLERKMMATIRRLAGDTDETRPG
jgi:hypothetical protein